jgi:hypothetical protein
MAADTDRLTQHDIASEATSPRARCQLSAPLPQLRCWGSLRSPVVHAARVARGTDSSKGITCLVIFKITAAPFSFIQMIVLVFEVVNVWQVCARKHHRHGHGGSKHRSGIVAA